MENSLSLTLSMSRISTFISTCTCIIFIWILSFIFYLISTFISSWTCIIFTWVLKWKKIIGSVPIFAHAFFSSKAHETLSPYFRTVFCFLKNTTHRSIWWGGLQFLVGDRETPPQDTFEHTWWWGWWSFWLWWFRVVDVMMMMMMMLKTNQAEWVLPRAWPWGDWLELGGEATNRAYIFIVQGVPKNWLIEKNPKIECCGAKFSHEHDLGALDPA